MKSHPFKFLHLNVRRSPCFECSGPAHPLGEAHRLDLAEGGFTVALDPTLTPDLKAEGFARELVSRIQRLRKDSDFDVQGVREAMDAARPAYKLLGKDDALQAIYPETQHDFPDDAHLRAYEFLDRYLKGGE